MINSKKILALIPARGGSTRVPKKNIRHLAGKPLICYTIECAKKSKYLDKIFVSTDSEEIASIARSYGAEVPVLRPPEISGKDSNEIDCIKHSLSWLSENEKFRPDLVVILFPTAPLRKPSSIDSAIKKMVENPDADSLRSVKLCSEHPYKMWQTENNRLVPFVKTEDKNMHTFSYHLLPETYIQNANIYITRPSVIEKKNSYIGDVILPFIMDHTESLDIHYEIDFDFIEYIIKKSAKKGGDFESNFA